jgi:hypothetical protein
MHVEGFFDALGHLLGTLIRFVVELLTGFFEMLSNAGRDFLGGLAQALGMQVSLLGFIGLLLGLLLLGLAVRALLRQRWFAGAVWLVLGLWLLSLIIH